MSGRAELTALDRVVGWLSPVAGLRRVQARAAYAKVSGYIGARRDRSSMRSWNTQGASADADTLPDLDTLRARSRDLVRNDPLAQSAIATKVVNVVGTGHVVRPEIDHERLGISRDQADEWEGLALDIWTNWAESPDCDVTRTQTFAELEDLMYRSRLLSGDVLAIRRFRPRKGRLLATCLQVVEADRLSNPNWQPDSATLAGGIALDEDGAPTHYHFANRHAIDRHRQGAVSWQTIPAYDRAGDKLVLHVHGVRWRPDMSRYAPLLAPVIESLKQRSRYSEAELMAAVVSACFTIGLRSEDGDLGAQLGATNAASGQSKGAAPINIVEPGQIFDILPNEEVKGFTPGRPNPQFSPFIDAIAQEIGTGTDLPYELLMKKFQASYSASRAALEMAWQFFRTDRKLHVTQFCKPVYADVIAEAIARGRLKAPGFFADPLIRSAWLNAEWMGPARPTIDPTKDADADAKYLDMGATSLTRITAERFGADFRSVRRRRSQDGSDGYSSKPNPAPGSTAKQDAEDDDNDNDLETE
jgi:lambda family phage portal protein